MLDTLLNIGSAFNWVSPLFAFFLDIFFGSACDFGVVAHAGWDRLDIQYLLKSNDVDVWGMMYNYDGDILMFTVRDIDAEFTYDLLASVGVPIEYSPLGSNFF
jgi:hypothetical protein